MIFFNFVLETTSHNFDLGQYRNFLLKRDLLGHGLWIREAVPSNSSSFLTEFGRHLLVDSCPAFHCIFTHTILSSWIKHLGLMKIHRNVFGHCRRVDFSGQPFAFTWRGSDSEESFCSTPFNWSPYLGRLLQMERFLDWFTYLHSASFHFNIVLHHQWMHSKSLWVLYLCLPWICKFHSIKLLLVRLPVLF